MDIEKLKIEKYESIRLVNFPEHYDLNIKPSEKPVDVIIYYINHISDVEKFVELVKETDLPKDNRTIMVYEKGRKDGVNRDSIYSPFKQGSYNEFKMRRPSLCSLSDKLSAFVQSWEG